MHMGFIGAGQGFGIHRDFLRAEAFLPMLVPQNLELAADQAAVCVIAGMGMAVERDLPHPTNKNRLRALRPAAGQLLLPGIAFVRMDVVALDAAGQLPGRLITAFAVGMLRSFRFPADEIFRLCPAVLCMGMKRTCKRSPFLGVAGIIMDMPRCIAGIRMGVGVYFRQRTPQLPAFIIAGAVMPMHQKIRIAAPEFPGRVIAGGRMGVDLRGTVGDRLRNGKNLGIAGIVVGMLRELALSFQSDRRDGQRIDGTQRHSQTKHRHDLMPSFL